MNKIKVENHVVVDPQGYFPPLVLFSEESKSDIDDFVYKLNWLRETFEAYRREFKSSSLKVITLINIISDLQDEIKELETEVKMLKMNKKPMGPIEKAVYEASEDTSYEAFQDERYGIANLWREK